MSALSVRICDRCGKREEVSTASRAGHATVHHYEIAGPNEWLIKVDLCTECFRILRRWCQDSGEDLDIAVSARVLDEIAEILRDPEWSAGMLEDIDVLVREAGRSTDNYPDKRPTWTRH